EAGSGKTEEMKDQIQRLRADNKVAFYATVQEVGRNGILQCLTPSEQTSFAAWQGSDTPAWFFLDSIDEAKLDGVRLDKAFREVAKAIHGVEARSHIVLSGRYTDWEFKSVSMSCFLYRKTQLFWMRRRKMN